ncbi:MAG: NAD(P)-binding domain-containing protein [Gaiellaceae bacterium]
MARIAVLGTGIMGGPMARNLLRAGHEVTAWEPDDREGRGPRRGGGPGRTDTCGRGS